MASVRFTIHPGVLERILRGPQSKGMQNSQARKIAAAWQGNINRLTGATDRSIAVEDDGDGYVVAADASRDPNSAWVFLEYGTSKMRAQAPGRRAIRRG